MDIISIILNVNCFNKIKNLIKLLKRNNKFKSFGYNGRRASEDLIKIVFY
jgi:hypothetical protein